MSMQQRASNMYKFKTIQSLQKNIIFLHKMTLWTEFLKKHFRTLYWETRHAQGKGKINSDRHRKLMKLTIQELSRRYRTSRKLPIKTRPQRKNVSHDRLRKKNVPEQSRSEEKSISRQQSRKKVKRNLYERMRREFHSLGRTKFVEKYGTAMIPRITDDPTGKCFKEAVACRKEWSQRKQDKQRRQRCEKGNRFQVLSDRATTSCLGETKQDLAYWLHPDGCVAINHKEKDKILEDHPHAIFSKHCYGWQGEYYHPGKEDRYIFERNQKETKEFQYPLSAQDWDTEATKKWVEEANNGIFLQNTRFKNKSQAEAFRHYVADSSPINTLLRSHFKILHVFDKNSRKEQQELLNRTLTYIENLDDAFRTVNTTFQSPVILFRGITLQENSILSPNIFFQKKPFKYRELAYTSTAYTFTSFARGFAGSIENDELQDLLENQKIPSRFGIVLVIQAPAGMAYIADNKLESEVLLPRGLTFTIDFAKYKLMKFMQNGNFIYVPAKVTLLRSFEKIPQHLEVDKNVQVNVKKW